MNTTSCYSAQINRDGPFGDRFWYWNGVSGRRYIHSVFRPEDCPSLPGAIYLGIHRHSPEEREVVVVGRFSPDLPEWANCLPGELGPDRGVDEIHVHLLAESDTEANRIIADLSPLVLPDPRSARASGLPPSQRGYGQLRKWFPTLRGVFPAFG